MRAKRNAIAIALFGAAALWAATAVAQTTTSTTQTRPFEVVSVVGNQLVVKGPDGNKEYTVPESFRFTVDGKQLSVHDLKVGMKGEATTTTLTTVKTVYVTEARSAKVMQAFGNAVILRTQDGKFRQFTQADADKYKIALTKDGKPIEFQQLRANDMVSGTFVTPKEETLTEQQVTARLAQQGGAAAATTGAAPAAAASTRPAAPPPPPQPAASSSAGSGASSGGAASKPKTLPKTASSLPLIGMMGAAFLALGLTMTFIRRRRAA